jgi:putative ABC transport system permease protein
VFQVRVALRTLSRNRAVALGVILTIGLSLGAMTALFSVVDGLLFRPLPFHESERIVHIAASAQVFQRMPVEGRRIREILATTPLIDTRTLAQSGGVFDEGSEALTEWRLRPVRVSPEFFSLLRVRPAIGRALAAVDDRQNPRPVILSDAVWRTRFGADSGIVNRVVTIPGTVGDREWVVVGVMPSGFSFPAGSNIWVLHESAPAPFGPDYARLGAGTTIDTVRRLLPNVTITPLREHVRPREGIALALVFVASGGLVVIAWIQLAGLAMAYVTGRRKEIAVYLALGAGRVRVATQFAIEGLLLAIAALLLGLGLVIPMTSAIVAVLPSSVTMGQLVQPDARAALFASSMAAIGLLCVFVVPLRIVAIARPNQFLRLRDHAEIRGRPTQIRNLLLIGQVALTTAIAYGGATASLDYVRARNRDLGFSPDGLVAVAIPETEASSSSERPQAERQSASQAAETLQALRRLPGVRSAIFASFFPLDYYRNTRPIVMPHDRSREFQVVQYSASAGLTDILGLTILVGREPPADEIPLSGTSAHVLVNKTFADQLGFAGGPVGQSLVGPFGEPTYRIFGVIENLAETDPDQPVRPSVYVFRHASRYDFTLLARLHPPIPTDASILDVFNQNWGRSRAPRRVVHLDDVVLEATARHRARAVLLGTIAVITIPLMAIGIVGTVSHSFKQRTRSIAIAIALGADVGHLRRQLVTGSLWPTLIGIGLGSGGGVLLTQAMSAVMTGRLPASGAAAAMTAGVLVMAALASAMWATRDIRTLNPAALLRDS